MYSSGDLVWVNLGYSYGWWPATVQEKDDVKKIDAFNVFESEVDTVEISSTSLLVKFFDDDNLEFSRVSDLKLLEPYTTKNKLKYIRAGLKRHKEKRGNSVDGGANIKLAQLCSDIEMAEVLSGSCDVRVSNLLMKVVQQMEEAQEAQETQEVQKVHSVQEAMDAASLKSGQSATRRAADLSTAGISAARAADLSTAGISAVRAADLSTAGISAARKQKGAKKKSQENKDNYESKKSVLNKVKTGKVTKPTQKSKRVLKSKN